MSKKSKKKKSEEKEQFPDWDENVIFPEEVKNEMESMWEIPQIFQFLHLAKEILNISHLTMYEMERMLLVPRASKQLANIMTSLLSSPITTAKLKRIPPMPYEFWTNILAYKMKSWFTVYEAKHGDAVKILETTGVEPEFWNVFPDAPLLNGKNFEDLTFKQKVWLLKTVCDTVLHTRKTVQDEIAKQPLENQYETVLGTDRYGARYIYFPQFLKTDLRVYRHCLDNKILSTVKPIKPKVDSSSNSEMLDQSDLTKKQVRRRKRKLRWSKGFPPKPRKKGSRCDERHLNDYKCNSDSATNSLINDDTNLSSTSSCSNNNNNNSSSNNNINSCTINAKRSRSSSKCSEISMESDKTHDTKTSGYDTNRSSDAIAENKSLQNMFKGFSDSGDSPKKNCSIGIINGMLDNLKMESCQQDTEDSGAASIHVSKIKLEVSPTNLSVCESNADDRTIDNLSNISKTDDEKLHEIISAEGSKLNEDSTSHAVIKIHPISISKSDDEKLNETKVSCDTIKENASPSDVKKGDFCRKANGRFAKKRKTSSAIANDKDANLKLTNKSGSSNDPESNDEKDLSLSELRFMLQKEAMVENSAEEESKLDYDIKNVKIEESDVWKRKANDFNEMLMELGVSKFQLVADSVSSLKNLISTLSEKGGATTDADGETESIPPCELKLVQELVVLLSLVEEMEPTLRDSTRKARWKLQKEWTNFKEGAEDQDSSGEGLGSNWWILGSQGCSHPTHGDSMLQTLSQPTVSSTGCRDVNNRNGGQDVDGNGCSSNNDQQCKEIKNEHSGNETRGSQPGGGENSDQPNADVEKKAKEESNEEERETRRVLRTRGISSYAFYSDDETFENELEGWTEVEAVYAAPSTQIDPSTPSSASKSKNSDDRTNEEDSDQDWILPSSRKRKNKRPSASRRLKSFQHKLQSIKLDTLENAAESTIVTSPVKNQKQKPKIKEIQTCKPNELIALEVPNTSSVTENSDTTVQSTEVPSNEVQNTVVQSTEVQNTVVENTKVQKNSKEPEPEPVPSMEMSCKLEKVESLHSELDIKDEGPIYDSAMGQCDNSYTASFNPNYVMLRAEQNPTNYYVMQPNPMNVPPPNAYGQPAPMVSNIISPVQHGYYVQGGQNYIIQSPQPNLMPPPPLQPQGPQMITPQQFYSQPGYVPYMVTPADPNSGYLTTDPQMIVPQEVPPQNIPTFTQPVSVPQTRPTQHYRYSTPRHTSHPHGAVIRSSMPIRGSFPRTNNGRTTKNVQQRVTERPPKPRKQSTPSENSNQKTTSLIVLSDSDDEIEMIITERTSQGGEVQKTKSAPRKNRENVTGNPNDPTTVSKGAISPQIIQRMSQGGISIIPIKTTAPPVQNTSTQLVVVLNETGSHYALSLPNGSKLILTPEQVAQIRASNGGKLIL